MDKDTGSEAGKASRAKRNSRPLCDLQTDTEQLGYLRNFGFGREINIWDEKESCRPGNIAQ